MKINLFFNFHFLKYTNFSNIIINIAILGKNFRLLHQLLNYPYNLLVVLSFLQIIL
jgi:hypothetical protein